MLAPNAVPNMDVSTSPIDEEQLAHTVESMLRDEPENNDEVALVIPVFLLFSMFLTKRE